MTATATRPLGIFILLRAAGSVEGYLEARLNEVGLSIPKLTALQRLADAGDALPLGQLAERLACVKSNVTQLVDRLEADGFVSRETDVADKRCRRATITDEGRRARETGARIQGEAERELLSSLTDEEREHLAEILGKLGARLKRCCQ